MHTVERLERAVAEAVQRGYEVRMEPLGGASGGLCEYGKRRWIFVDISASASEQLEQVLSALRAEAKREEARHVERESSDSCPPAERQKHVA